LNFENLKYKFWKVIFVFFKLWRCRKNMGLSLDLLSSSIHWQLLIAPFICFLHPIKERKCLTNPWGFICKGRKVLGDSHCAILMDVLRRSSSLRCVLVEVKVFDWSCFRGFKGYEEHARVMKNMLDVLLVWLCFHTSNIFLDHLRVEVQGQFNISSLLDLSRHIFKKKLWRSSEF